jgi:hypothetical protein
MKRALTFITLAAPLSLGCGLLVGESFEDRGPRPGPPPVSTSSPPSQAPSLPSSAPSSSSLRPPAPGGPPQPDGGSSDSQWRQICQMFYSCDALDFRHSFVDVDDCVQQEIAGAGECRGPAFDAYVSCILAGPCSEFTADVDPCGPEWSAVKSANECAK